MSREQELRLLSMLARDLGVKPPKRSRKKPVRQKLRLSVGDISQVKAVVLALPNKVLAGLAVEIDDELDDRYSM